MATGMDTLLSIAIGIGLSAACGFRVFIPLLIAGLAAHAGYLSPSPEFAWVGTTPAILAFGTAAVLEVLAYSIPWVDNALDAVAVPVATLAGMVASAAVFTDLPPLLKWTLAIIAGGAAAGAVQSATTLLRAKSTIVSGGLANFVVSTGELLGSVVTSLLAILVPLVCLAVLVVFGVTVWRLGRRVLGRVKSSSSSTNSMAGES